MAGRGAQACDLDIFATKKKAYTSTTGKALGMSTIVKDEVSLSHCRKRLECAQAPIRHLRESGNLFASQPVQ